MITKKWIKSLAVCCFMATVPEMYSASPTFPNTQTIRAGMFKGCSALPSFVIPDTVKTIEEEAFKGCSNLSSIVIPDSVTIIKESAFENCSNLKSIKIPASVKRIEKDAFKGSGLKLIEICGNIEIERRALPDGVQCMVENNARIKLFDDYKFYTGDYITDTEGDFNGESYPG